jgi:hypothetical protein
MRWDISTPSAPTQVSSYDLNDQARGVYFDGTNIFLATYNVAAEFYILGPGATAGAYAKESTFTSQTYDSGAASTWGVISWTESGAGDVVFRIRTADSEANLMSAIWVGSDGTGDTTYSTSGTAITVDPGASGTQWVQWKAYLSGDSLTTPVLQDITLTY